MDSSLFLKYTTLLTENTFTKTAIILEIKKTTGITLTPEQIKIEKNNLILFVTSAVRTMLIAKGIHKSLETLGYTYYSKL